jgi:hypothetical protein
MQSMFEASMYSFVFLWTMAMSPNKEGIKHGLIFVNFMTACMAGRCGDALCGACCGRGVRGGRSARLLCGLLLVLLVLLLRLPGYLGRHTVSHLCLDLWSHTPRTSRTAASCRRCS